MEQDSELVHCLFPNSRWHCPLFSGIAQGQIQKLGRGVIIGEMTPVFDHLNFAAKLCRQSGPLQLAPRVSGYRGCARRDIAGPGRTIPLPPC